MQRLFHTILPIPECCGTQMRLGGNTSLHEVHYQCSRCFKSVNVVATFVENKALEADAKTLAETDATP